MSNQGKSLRRLGKVTRDPLDLTKRALTALPWAHRGQVALQRYRKEQPGPEDVARVAAYQLTPIDFLENPHLRVQMLENELGHLQNNFLTVLERELGTKTACKVSYAAGFAHGKRRISTYFAGQGLSGGARALAMWQDFTHSSLGLRHTTGLFARYDDELVEVVRTQDSFGSHTGNEAATMVAYIEGIVDGYRSVDPSFAYIEELVRERADGVLEFIHRFWFAPRK